MVRHLVMIEKVELLLQKVNSGIFASFLDRKDVMGYSPVTTMIMIMLVLIKEYCLDMVG